MKFTEKHREYVRVDADVEAVIDSVDREADVKIAAQLFGKEINETMGALKRKQQKLAHKWTTKLGTFLTKLYPLTRLSINVAGTLAAVNHLLVESHHRAQTSTPSRVLQMA